MVGLTWLLLGAAAVLAISYSWWKTRYWAAKGVPAPPLRLFLGHAHKTFHPKARHDFENVVYNQYGGNKFCGLYAFHRPWLLVGDPDLLRHIFVKDFDYFTDRRSVSFNMEKDKVMANMLSMKNGEEWKRLRSVMSPTFTSGKMKGMFPLVAQKADDLVSFCLQEASRKPCIDMKYTFGRYTMDAIASCAFGIECNSLVDEKPVFAEKVDEFFSIKINKLFEILTLYFFPRLAKALGCRFTAESIDFFEEVAYETLAARRKGEKRGDFLDLLLEAKIPTGISAESQQPLDDLSIVSQSVLFLVSGYDTTASTLAFASYLLAKHPKAQQRLRQEMEELVEEHGDITYQGIMEAKFMDSVLMETLRIYPPAVFLERKCVKDYKLPDTDVTIEAGTIVACPVRSLHMDPKYWPEPDAFRPERFLPENKASITGFTHLPFGMGPRNCLAMRFGLMEAKVALAKLLLASEVTLAPEYQLELDVGLGLLKAKNGVNVILKPLNG